MLVLVLSGCGGSSKEPMTATTEVPDDTRFKALNIQIDETFFTDVTVCIDVNRDFECDLKTDFFAQRQEKNHFIANVPSDFTGTYSIVASERIEGKSLNSHRNASPLSEQESSSYPIISVVDVTDSSENQTYFTNFLSTLVAVRYYQHTDDSVNNITLIQNELAQALGFSVDFFRKSTTNDVNVKVQDSILYSAISIVDNIIANTENYSTAQWKEVYSAITDSLTSENKDLSRLTHQSNQGILALSQENLSAASSLYNELKEALVELKTIDSVIDYIDEIESRLSAFKEEGKTVYIEIDDAFFSDGNVCIDINLDFMCTDADVNAYKDNNLNHYQAMLPRTANGIHVALAVNSEEVQSSFPLAVLINTNEHISEQKYYATPLSSLITAKFIADHNKLNFDIHTQQLTLANQLNFSTALFNISPQLDKSSSLHNISIYSTLMILRQLIVNTSNYTNEQWFEVYVAVMNAFLTEQGNLNALYHETNHEISNLSAQSLTSAVDLLEFIHSTLEVKHELERRSDDIDLIEWIITRWVNEYSVAPELLNVNFANLIEYCFENQCPTQENDIVISSSVIESEPNYLQLSWSTSFNTNEFKVFSYKLNEKGEKVLQQVYEINEPWLEIAQLSEQQFITISPVVNGILMLQSEGLLLEGSDEVASCGLLE